VRTGPSAVAGPSACLSVGEQGWTAVQGARRGSSPGDRGRTRFRRCKSVRELVDTLGVRQPLVSQHLRVLRSARLVTAERRNRPWLYRLVNEHVGHIVTDALQHALEHPAKESGSGRVRAR
jgi:DNA-binding transcriptional ArsR family regulator